jgi:hypothetical protein
MTDINTTLAERGQRYGAFRDHAVIAQDIKEAMWAREGWARLAPDQKQALEVIADKMARILNGDPEYHDNWHDIVGYAKLVADRLLESQTALTPPMSVTEVADMLNRVQPGDKVTIAGVQFGEDTIGQRGV